MLKISVTDTRTHRRLILEGRLIAPWVAELKTAWTRVKAGLNGRELLIDIENVTVISQEGENALLQLINEGAEFRCRGVLTKHLLKQLARRGKKSANEFIDAASQSVGEQKGKNESAAYKSDHGRETTKIGNG